MSHILNFNDGIDWEDDSNIPTHTQKAIEDYLLYGYAPGGFLTSMFANDIFSAVYKADSANRHHLNEITKWIVTQAPVASKGSYKAVENWCNDVNGHRTAYSKEITLKVLSE
jgi:hypothetical protein